MCRVVVVIIPRFSYLPQTAKQQRRRVDRGWYESLEAVINREASFSVWEKCSGAGERWGVVGPLRGREQPPARRERAVGVDAFLGTRSWKQGRGVVARKSVFCHGHCHSRVDVWCELECDCTE